MALFETIFDLTYLILVIGLGIRLVLSADRTSQLFGTMGILLGFGDAFHLLPRIISHLSPGGFAAHAAALSWGQFVTSITMTLFYVLYYLFLKRQTGLRSSWRDAVIYTLAALRIILVLMPQNGWGTMPGNYTFGLLRNLPFAIMGILLMVWSWQARRVPGLKHMGTLILFSFLFYAPVVLWADTIPVLGALMMPKTIAYLLLVIAGFRFFQPTFRLRSILELSIVSLVLGLIAGVFRQGLSRFYGAAALGSLVSLYTHSLVLGFAGLLLIYFVLTLRNPDPRPFITPVRLWVSGLVVTILMMTIQGLIPILGTPSGTISPTVVSILAGLGHILLATGLVWTMTLLAKVEGTAAGLREVVE